jgi:hypothetical protein
MSRKTAEDTDDQGELVGELKRVSDFLPSRTNSSCVTTR